MWRAIPALLVLATCSAAVAGAQVIVLPDDSALCGCYEINILGDTTLQIELRPGPEGARYHSSRAIGRHAGRWTRGIWYRVAPDSILITITRAQFGSHFGSVQLNFTLSIESGLGSVENLLGPGPKVHISSQRFKCGGT